VNRAELSVGAVSGAPYIVTLDDERDVLRSVGTGQLEILQVERKSRSETGADSWIFDVRITY